MSQMESRRITFGPTWPDFPPAKTFPAPETFMELLVQLQMHARGRIVGLEEWQCIPLQDRVSETGKARLLDILNRHPLAQTVTTKPLTAAMEISL